MKPRRYNDSTARLADDSELELLSEYCGGSMTEEQMQAFERRLAEDEAFFDRVAPFLKIWYSRKPLVTVVSAPQHLPAVATVEHAGAPAPRRTVWRRPQTYGRLATLVAAAAVAFVAVHNWPAAPAAKQRDVALKPKPNDTLSAPAVPKQVAVRPRVAAPPTKVAEWVPSYDSLTDRLIDALVAREPLAPTFTPTGPHVQTRTAPVMRVAVIPPDTMAMNVYQRIRALDRANAAGEASGGGMSRWPAGVWRWLFPPNQPTIPTTPPKPPPTPHAPTLSGVVRGRS
jgi:hypothetical protein